MTTDTDRVPVAFPKYVPDVDADTTPCLIEVAPEHRRPRDRWWRPGSAGYTNDLAEAGLYPHHEAAELCGSCDYPVCAWDVLDLHLSRLRHFEHQLTSMPNEDP